VQDAQRREIVGGEERGDVRRRLEQRTRSGVPALLREVALGEEPRIGPRSPR
jgi:hypothetical protein